MSSVGSTIWYVGRANDGMWGMPSGTSTECNVYSISEKDVKTRDNMSIKMSSSPVSNPAQPLPFYETTQRKFSIASFIDTYQNELPKLVMIKEGYLGDTDSNLLNTGQVLRIHGVHSERRVLAKVTEDWRHYFGFRDVTLSIPLTFPIPMCFAKTSCSSNKAKLLKNIIKNHTLPVTVQLIDTIEHDIKLAGNMVLLTGGVKLRLLKEYEEKYIYGNPVKTGEVYWNVISVPSCESNIRLSVITSLSSHNYEHWQSILELMTHTVTKYINFDGKICNTEIFDCSSSDLKIEKLVDEIFTEPGENHSSEPKEKALDETFTEPGNKYPSGPKIRSPDIGSPCDIKTLKPLKSSFDIYSLSVRDLGHYLHILNIGQHAGKLYDAQIDGTLMKELDENILVEEFGFERFEAVILMTFARHAYLPINDRRILEISHNPTMDVEQYYTENILYINCN